MKSYRSFLFIFSIFIGNSFFINSSSYVWTITGGANSMTGQNNYDGAGSSVAMTPDGNVMVVGEPGEGLSSGRVRIYNFIDGIYVETGDTAAMYGDSLNLAGQAVAINSDGTMVVIGEPGWNSNSGRARAFNVSGTTWVETGGALSMIGQSANQRAGSSVAMSADGKTVIVGEPSAVGSAMDGIARVYNLTGGVWTEIGSFTGTPGSLSNPNLFGYSVDMSSDGKIVVIGAPDTSVIDKHSIGQVVVYNLSGSSWIQLGNSSDIQGENAGDQAGYSVAINSDGTIVAVGEPVWNLSEGRVRVYSFSNSSWVQVGGATDMAGQNYRNSAGLAVAINSDGTIVSVGEPNWNGEGSYTLGRVQVYTLSGKNWVLVGGAADMAGKNYGDLAGSAVAMSADGKRVAVGEPGWSEGNSNGRVRVYVLSADFNPNRLLAKTLYSDVASPTTPGARSNLSPGQGTPFGHSLTSYIIAKGQ